MFGTLIRRKPLRALGQQDEAFEFDQFLAVDRGAAARGAARRPAHARDAARRQADRGRRPRTIDPRAQRLRRRADGRAWPSARWSATQVAVELSAQKIPATVVWTREGTVGLQVRPERRPWRAARRAQAAPRLPPAPAAARGRLQGDAQARQDLLHGRRPRHLARRAQGRADRGILPRQAGRRGGREPAPDQAARCAGSPTARRGSCSTSRSSSRNWPNGSASGSNWRRSRRASSAEAFKPRAARLYLSCSKQWR